MRVGWGISGSAPYPLHLQLDLELAALPEAVREGLSRCLQRYRDGDTAGAITAICGIVDSLTEEIYSANKLGNHRNDSYQQRVNRSFNSLEDNYRQPLSDGGLDRQETNQLWQNHRGAVNHAAYVLGSFRRVFSDAHGAQAAPVVLVPIPFK